MKCIILGQVNLSDHSSYVLLLVRGEGSTGPTLADNHTAETTGDKSVELLSHPGTIQEKVANYCLYLLTMSKNTTTHLFTEVESSYAEHEKLYCMHAFFQKKGKIAV